MLFTFFSTAAAFGLITHDKDSTDYKNAVHLAKDGHWTVGSGDHLDGRVSEEGVLKANGYNVSLDLAGTLKINGPSYGEWSFVDGDLALNGNSEFYVLPSGELATSERPGGQLVYLHIF